MLSDCPALGAIDLHWDYGQLQEICGGLEFEKTSRPQVALLDMLQGDLVRCLLARSRGICWSRAELRMVTVVVRLSSLMRVSMLAGCE